MKTIILFLFFSVFSVESLASVALNEFTLERKVELSTRIYFGEVVGIVKINDDTQGINEYVKLRIVDSVFGSKINEFVNVVSDNGFPGSKLGIKCIGGIYLLFLRDYRSLEFNMGNEVFFESVNLKFSVYKVENEQVINFTNGKNLSILETKETIKHILQKNKAQKNQNTEHIWTLP